MKLLYLLMATLFSTTLLGQSLKSVSPISASKGEKVVLSILSKNTFFKTGTNAVKLSNPSFPVIHAISVTAVNDTLIEAEFSFSLTDSAARYDVVVDNSQTGSSLILPKAFKLNPRLPVFVSITPAFAAQGDSVEVTVTLRYTHFLQSTWSQIMLLDSNDPGRPIFPFTVTAVNDTIIKGRFAFNYMQTPVEYDVYVSSNIDPSFMQEKAFSLKPGSMPPQILSITPNTARKLDSVLVEIKGKNMFFKRDSSYIFLRIPSGGGIEPTTYKVINDSVMTLSFVFSNQLVEGQLDVVSISRLGTFILPKAFTLNASLNPPAIISFDPMQAKQGDSIILSVRGKHTHFLKGKNGSLSLADKNNGGLDLVSLTVINDTLMQGKFRFTYNHKPGQYRLGVYNSLDGFMIANDKFTLNEGDHPPKLLHVSPNKTVQGKQLDIYLTATKGFFSIFKPDYVYLSGINNKSIYKKSMTIVNDSVLKIGFNFTIDTNLVGVYNLDLYGYRYGHEFEGISLPNAFTIERNINPPTLSSVNPSMANQFDSVSVTVRGKGTHFLNNAVSAVYLTSNANIPYIPCKSFVVQDDSTIVCQFVFNANYYTAKVYDVTVYSGVDGTLLLKNAFTIKNLYDQEPRIISIDPKQSTTGVSFVMNITGVKGSFRPGVIQVNLADMGLVSKLEATTVNYVNDSLIAASFSIPGTAPIGNYYVFVKNNITLLFSYFSLLQHPSELTGMTPSVASQTDSIDAVITGSKTHFDALNDKLWLQGSYGMKIKPVSVKTINDSVMHAHFKFTKEHLPDVYMLYLESAKDKITLKLKNALTLTGMLDTVSLTSVSPETVLCNFKQVLAIKGGTTFFLSEVDTIHVVNYDPLDHLVVYPSKMKIVDDETIVADFALPCGRYDVVVLGKNNYVLKGRLFAHPPLPVEEILGDKSLAIFPNPSDGMFTIEVGERYTQGELRVIDMYGKEILRNEKIDKSTQIDLSAYTPGLYFVQLMKGGTCRTEKIIKH